MKYIGVELKRNNAPILFHLQTNSQKFHIIGRTMISLASVRAALLYEFSVLIKVKRWKVLVVCSGLQ